VLADSRSILIDKKYLNQLLNIHWSDGRQTEVLSAESQDTERGFADVQSAVEKVWPLYRHIPAQLSQAGGKILHFVRYTNVDYFQCIWSKKELLNDRNIFQEIK
jgi:hypothetical protein